MYAYNDEKARKQVDKLKQEENKSKSNKHTHTHMSFTYQLAETLKKTS